VPNVIYTPSDPRADLTTGDIAAYGSDASFPLSQLPLNRSNIAVWFSIDAERGCEW